MKVRVSKEELLKAHERYVMCPSSTKHFVLDGEVVAESCCPHGVVGTHCPICFPSKAVAPKTECECGETYILDHAGPCIHDKKWKCCDRCHGIGMCITPDCRCHKQAEARVGALVGGPSKEKHELTSCVDVNCWNHWTDNQLRPSKKIEKLRGEPVDEVVAAAFRKINTIIDRLNEGI